MPAQIVVSRVEDLETRVTMLEQLPARVDDLTSQVSQLRTEMRAEFSDVRAEMGAQFSAVRAEMADQGATLGTQMRVLHEDVIGRLALLQNGYARRKAKPRGRKKHDERRLREVLGRAFDATLRRRRDAMRYASASLQRQAG
ncbi:MAG: hypothetical protein M3545_04990 [Acidobacteriota bacterium]|nr:hypothetical protein [Acidobacteriota bacterium]